jgi:hypothetical protein
MSDESILNRIESLVDEEHRLLRREQDDASDEDALAGDRGRLELRAVELDRSSDLPPPPRAPRNAGIDPDGAQVRDADTVEHYRL